MMRKKINRLEITGPTGSALRELMGKNGRINQGSQGVDETTAVQVLNLVEKREQGTAVKGIPLDYLEWEESLNL